MGFPTTVALEKAEKIDSKGSAEVRPALAEVFAAIILSKLQYGMDSSKSYIIMVMSDRSSAAKGDNISFVPSGC